MSKVKSDELRIGLEILSKLTDEEVGSIINYKEFFVKEALNGQTQDIRKWLISWFVDCDDTLKDFDKRFLK